MRESGLLLRCVRTYNGITVNTSAKEETTSGLLAVLLQTRVRGVAPKNTTAARPESWVSSTLRWGSWQIYDGTAVDRLVGLDYFGARYFSAAQGRFTRLGNWLVGVGWQKDSALSEEQTEAKTTTVQRTPASDEGGFVGAGAA